MKKFFLVVALLGVVAFAGLTYMRQARQDIVLITERFFSQAATGNARAAAELAPELENQDALLAALEINDMISLGEIGEIRLLSVRQAESTIGLLIGADKEEMQVAVNFMRTAEGWKISRFSNLTVLPLALVGEVRDSSLILLNDAGISYSFTNTELTSLHRGSVGSAVAIANNLVYFNPLEEGQLNKLLTIKDDALEGEETGFVSLADDTVFYRVEDNEYRKASKEELIVGMQGLAVFKEKDKIQAIILPQEFVPDKIRVVLHTTDFGGLGHKTVKLTASTPYTLDDKINGESLRFGQGDTLTFAVSGNEISVSLPSGGLHTFKNRLYIRPEKNGRVQIETIQRGSPVFTPSYRGHLEVAMTDGQINLVNEVPMESYLYSVVPSEMPVSFGLTPLKAQAVAARSYAVASILRSGFRMYAAHVDDSTASQVYNNVPELDISNEAVNATTGLVVNYNGYIADTRFFSTSSGVTANFHDTWQDPVTGEFPATPRPYLVSRSQLAAGTLPDVSTEEGARSLFASTGWNGFDRVSPWFRWEVEMTRSELEAVIVKYLPQQSKAQPLYVLPFDGEGFVPMTVPQVELGELRDIRVNRRGTGGNVIELEIEGTKGSYRVIKELNIRFTLRPVKVGGSRDIVLQRHDGSELKNYTILPSTFMVIDIKRDNQDRIVTVRFRGGGNGHGVGMSQWGTRGLAEAGHSYVDILSHYYPGTTLEKMY